MDPTLQEFYSLSRSTSHERPLSLCHSTSQNLTPSRSSSRLQNRPQSANAYAWSQHPMSVPAIAQIYLQPNYQPGNHEGDQSLLQNSSHRRDHTAGSNPGSYANSILGADAASMNDNESIQNDLLARTPQRSSIAPPPPPSSSLSMYSQSLNDPSLFMSDNENNQGISANEHPRVERLDDIDDNESYLPQHSGPDARSHNIDDPYGQYCDDENNGHDDTSLKQEPTPLPKIPLFVLSIVIFSEPLTSTILFPFVYFMFCTSIFWGFMSDRHGRRPILLLGLCGSTVACILFGLSKSLAWAIASRAMCGLLNGNVGVAKSMLGEIADHTNQSQAFGLFGFAWGIGMIVGPVLGGYLANPAKTFPDIFGNWPFFIEYPYFLPCFVAAMGSVVGFIVGYFFLEETRGKRKIDEGDDFTQEENSHSTDYQNNNQFPDSRYGSGEDDDYRSLKTADIASRPTSPSDFDNEHQPLMMPHPQQIKFANRRSMGHSTQYGSTITLTLGAVDNSASSHLPHTYTTSARSTLSRRPPASRPSIVRHQRTVSASGEIPSRSNYVNQPVSVEHNSLYSYRSLSSGHFQDADITVQTPQGIATIPADATSLNLYGYTQDPFLDSYGRGGLESGRRSRMSLAPSQIYVLPPDPNNKDPNQPVQVIVVQSEVGLSPLSITTIVAYAMLALHSIVCEEVYTLFAVTPLKSHGLGWNAIQLSTSLASMGIVQLFMQFVAYPKLERRFSAVWLFRCAQLLYVCVYISFPLIRTFAVDENDGETGGQTPLVRNLVLTVLVFKYLCSVFSYTSVMVMVKTVTVQVVYDHLCPQNINAAFSPSRMHHQITNSAPSHLLGTVNGIGQTSASFMRAFGPALGGIIWAWSLSNKLGFPFNYFFVFFLMGTIAILGFIHIKREMDAITATKEFANSDAKTKTKMEDFKTWMADASVSLNDDEILLSYLAEKETYIVRLKALSKIVNPTGLDMELIEGTTDFDVERLEV
ncbi:hypothetical protein BGX27_005086 [Mortierella sp. AM989]|nr:hypothetical protein BGX27_005086 [Mortierella sp. AM989]